MHECLQASCRSPKQTLSKACVPHTSVLFCSSKWILTLLHSRGLKNPACNHLTFSVTMSDEPEVRKRLKMFDGIWFFQTKLLELYHSLWHRNCSASMWFLGSTERQWPQPSNNNCSKQLGTEFFFQNPTWESKTSPKHIADVSTCHTDSLCDFAEVLEHLLWILSIWPVRLSRLLQLLHLLQSDADSVAQELRAGAQHGQALLVALGAVPAGPGELSENWGCTEETQGRPKRFKP